jgi:hypothetical protein
MNSNRKQAEELTRLIREVRQSEGLESINQVVPTKRVSTEASVTLGNLRKEFDDAEKTVAALGELAFYRSC